MLFKHADLKVGTVFCLAAWAGGPEKDGELEVPDAQVEEFEARFPQFRQERLTPAPDLQDAGHGDTPEAP